MSCTRSLIATESKKKKMTSKTTLLCTPLVIAVRNEAAIGHFTGVNIGSFSGQFLCIFKKLLLSIVAI